MNYRMIKHILGLILIFESLFMLVPAITAIVYGEWNSLHAFGLAILLCAASGWLMMRKKPVNTALYAKEGFVIVALSWITLSLFGALPFCISGDIPSYVDALFETVSGFTTTGASILSEVEALPHAMLMWRSFTHWVGGMGVLVFIMAFVPLSGGQNMHIMKAESPGPSVSKLVPRVRTTALILYGIYLGMSLLQFILLICGNMSVFDALNTTFSTAGTGGFSFRNDGFASYSPYIQIVVTVFMLLFSVNFSCYFLLFIGHIKDAFNLELRWFILIVTSAITIITINIAGMFDSVGEALRHAAFSVASLISTTGFATVDFNLWPEVSRAVLVLIMFVGACAGSTGGGIKVSRLIILCKSMRRELGKMVFPHRVRKTTMDGHPLEEDTIRSTSIFMVCYFLIFAGAVLLISFDNHDMITNFTAVTATINNVGPGLGAVGPTGNYGFFSIPSKLILTFCMLAGRLEIFPMLALIMPRTWKK